MNKNSNNIQTNSREVDISTLVGICIGLSLVLFGILSGGGKLSGYIDFTSILIVIGGTFAVTLACFSFQELITVFPISFRMICYVQEEPESVAIKSLSAAEIVKKNGFLALQNIAANDDNEFYAKAVNLVIDNLNPQTIEKILEDEINSTANRYSRVVSILKRAAEIAPAMGLIGTLIGLLQMLGTLADVSKIGPAMAVALLTTFYGAILSYMVFYPLASKIERNARIELLNAKIYLKAFTAIAKKENPRELEIKLNSLLSPNARVKYF